MKRKFYISIIIGICIVGVSFFKNGFASNLTENNNITKENVSVLNSVSGGFGATYTGVLDTKAENYYSRDNGIEADYKAMDYFAKTNKYALSGRHVRYIYTHGKYEGIVVNGEKLSLDYIPDSQIYEYIREDNKIVELKAVQSMTE